MDDYGYQAPPAAPQGGPVKNSKATIGLVCGIISAVFGGFLSIFLAWTVFVPVVGIAAGVVGIIMSVGAKKEGAVGGSVTAGLVLSFIGLALGGLLFLVCGIPVLCVTCAAGNAVNDLSNFTWN